MKISKERKKECDEIQSEKEWNGKTYKERKIDSNVKIYKKGNIIERKKKRKKERNVKISKERKNVMKYKERKKERKKREGI